MTVRSIVQEWLDEGRTAWISSQGLHPFALLDKRADDLALKVLRYLTEEDSPAREGALDTQVSSEKQGILGCVETTSPAKETTADTKEGPPLKEVSPVLKRA